MELRQVKSFVVLADELHFGRAAAILHMSPPALTQQIKALEKDLNTALFSRDRRHVELTDAGRVFLARAHPLLAAAQAAVQELRDHAKGVTGHLRVGLFVNNAAELTVPILQRFRAEHPRVQVSFVPLDFAGQITGITEGRVDVAFVRPPLAHAELFVRTLALEPRVALMSDSNKLAEAESLTADDLRDAEFIDWHALSMPRLWTNFWLLMEERNATKPTSSSERRLDSFDAVLVDIAVNETMTTVPYSVGREVGGVAPVRHVLLEGLDCEIAIAKRSGDSNEIVNRFFQVAEETSRELIGLVPGARASG